MAIVTMAFSFTVGPYSTHMTSDQIANVLHEVATEQRFVGFINRTLNKPRPNQNYGPFAPTDDDEHFVLDATRKADWRFGWRREYTEFTPQHGTRDIGWRVIFEVFETGPARHVVANVHGKSDRQEVKRFVRDVLGQLGSH
jgi:hypothetical protein